MIETIFKKLGKSRGITIPRRYCEQLGITGGSGITISLEKNSITINPSADTCILCGSVEELTKHGTHSICKKCAAEIAQGV